jgi:hypothetical protein
MQQRYVAVAIPRAAGSNTFQGLFLLVRQLYFGKASLRLSRLSRIALHCTATTPHYGGSVQPICCASVERGARHSSLHRPSRRCTYIRSRTIISISKGYKYCIYPSSKIRLHLEHIHLPISESECAKPPF